MDAECYVNPLMDGAVGMRAPPHVGYIAGRKFGIKGLSVVAMSRAHVLCGVSEHLAAALMETCNTGHHCLYGIGGTRGH